MKNAHEHRKSTIPALVALLAGLLAGGGAALAADPAAGKTAPAQGIAAKVLKGTYAGKTIRVAQWGMLDLKPTPLAAQEPGTSVKLVLETFADHEELVQELISDTLKEDFELKLYTDVNL